MIGFLRDVDAAARSGRLNGAPLGVRVRSTATRLRAGATLRDTLEEDPRRRRAARPGAHDHPRTGTTHASTPPLRAPRRLPCRSSAWRRRGATAVHRPRTPPIALAASRRRRDRRAPARAYFALAESARSVTTHVLRSARCPATTKRGFRVRALDAGGASEARGARRRRPARLMCAITASGPARANWKAPHNEPAARRPRGQLRRASRTCGGGASRRRARADARAVAAVGDANAAPHARASSRCARWPRWCGRACDPPAAGARGVARHPRRAAPTRSARAPCSATASCAGACADGRCEHARARWCSRVRDAVGAAAYGARANTRVRAAGGRARRGRARGAARARGRAGGRRAAVGRGSPTLDGARASTPCSRAAAAARTAARRRATSPGRT